MLKAAHDGDYQEARRLHHLLLPLQQACFAEPNPSPVKGALSRVWEPVGDVRPPLLNPSEDTLAAVEKALGAISSS
jgi:4-hydroxy-tetrahydrodipicolinate synthase